MPPPKQKPTAPSLPVLSGRDFSHVAAAKKSSIILAASTWRKTDYSGLTVCGQSKDTVLYSEPDLTVSLWEFNGVVPAEAAFKGPLQNATAHCMAYHRVLQGKFSATTACLWTDPSGDTFIGETVDVPDKPGVWTFLSGTGKWKGISGGGTYTVTAAGKPAADGTMGICFSPSGKWKLP
ncbi:MAG: hypothetical protein ABSE69_04940 [Roseiarcus sp.]